MKAKIYYLLTLSSFFLHTRHAFASGAGQCAFRIQPFQKIQHEDLAVPDNSQNSTACFSVEIDVDDDVFADVDIDDDDDDVSFSARKKISFEEAISFNTAQYTLQHFYDNSPGKYCSAGFYHLPPSHFISLRVFRV